MDKVYQTTQIVKEVLYIIILVFIISIVGNVAQIVDSETIEILEI